MSQYQQAKRELEGTKCDKCFGSGRLDDSDFGDISFNEWECQYCKGTGVKQLAPVNKQPTQLQRKIRDSQLRLRPNLHPGSRTVGQLHNSG